MHDLVQIYRKIKPIVRKSLKTKLKQGGNLHFYRMKPKMSDVEIISLSITSEIIGIDSERYLWSKIRTNYKSAFPNLIHLSNYNRRRKSLAKWLHFLIDTLGSKTGFNDNIYVVDSVPIPVIKNVREKRMKICKEYIETSADKGYSAINKHYYIGYKLHLTATKSGAIKDMHLSKASLHDVKYLDVLKDAPIGNITLLGDKAYISKKQQISLFEHAEIELCVPYRSNQKIQKPVPNFYKKYRCRIETIFSQLCDQFMLKRNYAKTFAGVESRVFFKMAAFSMSVLWNFLNGKPLGNIKHAFAI